MAIQHFLADLVVGALDADGDIAKTMRLQRIDCAAADRAKAEDHHLALVAVVTIDALQLQRMQHRAVARHLVVGVEDVQAEGAVVVPVVHRLPRYEGQSVVDRDLGERLVLDGMRPPPQDLTAPQGIDVTQDRLRLQDDVGDGQDLVARQNSFHELGQVLIRHTEPSAIPLLQDDVLSQVLIDVLEVLRMDYIRTARAKGLTERVVITRHMVKNALIPVVTFLGPALAGLITGSFIIETMFGFPGMGRAYVTAIQQRDYSMIMGTTLMFAVLVALANLSVDFVYTFLDPRIQLSD